MAQQTETWRAKMRRFRLGLQTLLGSKRGFFIPYRYAASIADSQPVYAEIEAVLRAAEPQFIAVLQRIAAYEAALKAFSGPPPAPRFDQSWFPTLDAAACYAIIRDARPSRIVEVGSGHSTRFLARAAQDGGFSCNITCIDPQPRASLRGLPVDFRPGIAQTADPAIYAALAAGDVLFIDSSHILMPGSDVDFLFSRVLPRLPAGVLLHIHDIFLPDDYPRHWLWRGYNEQQLLPAMLMAGWQPIFASHYAATRMAASVQAGPVGRLPASAEALPASIWLRKL
ncbi:class I SAM-dependent methyltransferase [Ferrovibrio sp.]|uniref:class I SAM-dependent methyltransferase n=1 Tax=Ferrovibrio sp. TaxID=1917215 RepID=UPI0035AE2E18